MISEQIRRLAAQAEEKQGTLAGPDEEDKEAFKAVQELYNAADKLADAGL